MKVFKMKKFRFLTSGESHGMCLNAIIEGLPSNIYIDTEFVDSELARRQSGYGRGGRMQIETDKAHIKSGVRFSKTTGAPICLEITNKDWANWQIPMSVSEVDLSNPDIKDAVDSKKITRVRPGHADLAGALKYNHKDVRNILERSSARETASRVAVGAIAKCFLTEFGITGFSRVLQIGNAFDTTSMKQEIDNAKENGDTLGGRFEVIFKNLPVGLGSFVNWDRRLEGLLAQALMSIPAVKAVEVGAGCEAAHLKGSQMHDEIFFEPENGGRYYRKTNNAGGIEGGMTNGEDVVLKVTMKAIPTMKKPLNSVDIHTKEAYSAHFERSDSCAVEACAVVAEAMCATVFADVFLEKFGGDSLEEIKANYEDYMKMIGS